MSIMHQFRGATGVAMIALAGAGLVSTGMMVGMRMHGVGRAESQAVSRASARGDEPAPAKVAVCDLYSVGDKLMATDRFKPARDAEEKRINDALEPLAKELQRLEDELRTASPQDKDAQAKFVEFRRKQGEFENMRGQLDREYRVFVSRQFRESYTLARASADSVGEELGYDYVIATRSPDDEIKTDDPQRVIEAILARPVIRFPKGADITTDVLEDLKIE